jgi:acetylglutamate kinase
MKNAFYITITLVAFALAIALSSGKLGGISDMEARKRASEPLTR